MNSEPAKSAVVLLSGGLDSATTLAIARSRGFACHGLSFDYGQRHRFELQAARQVAGAWDVVEHRVVNIDLSADGGFGHSALTDRIDVPKDRPEDDSIPSTYVPARNTIFLSIGLGYAEVIGACDIFVGVNAVDYSGYPDCRPEFIRAFEAMANLATAAATEKGRKLSIHAPLIELTKAQIIRTGAELGVDYAMTHSCYDPDSRGRACGHCDSCRLRRAGFVATGVDDPTIYQPEGD
ncbi:MAG: 7-cyano-7-deazaguanine synthase QueC [Phycisphaerae bacterium]